MTYSTLEYDMNRPSTKVINVPLDSDYGIAVKVYRDGQLTRPSLSVGDQQATGQTRADWQLFELSSGSEPASKLMYVHAAETSKTHMGHVWTDHDENPGSSTIFRVKQWPLEEAGFPLDVKTKIKAADTSLQAWVAGDADATPYVRPSQDESLYVLSGDMWVPGGGGDPVESLEVDGQSNAQVAYALSAGQMAEIRLVMETEQISEGEAVGFKLVVNEQDMSMIVVG